MLRSCLLSGRIVRPSLAYISISVPEKANRIIRQEPGNVRYAFIPEEWFTFFYKKTGVTGPYTFGVTVSTYLLSKEVYVMEHNFYNGLGMAVMWYFGIKYLGPRLAAYLDKEIDDYESQWNEGRDIHKRNLEEVINHEEQNQWRMEGQIMVNAVNRENVALQYETAYRERLMKAYNEVKNRLDYHVEKRNVEERFMQKNLVDWVLRKVKESYTLEEDKKYVDSCLDTLKALAAKINK